MAPLAHVLAVAALGCLEHVAASAVPRQEAPAPAPAPAPGAGLFPKPNPTDSYWMADPPFDESLRQRKDELPGEADVVIIGSGMTGLAAARSILLADSAPETSPATGADGSGSKCDDEPPRRRRRQAPAAGSAPSVVVIEARDLASGASARNGGHIKVSTGLTYDAMIERGSTPERAAQIVQIELNTLELLKNVSSNFPAAEVREVQTYDVYTNATMYAYAKAAFERTASNLSLEFEYVETAEDRAKYGFSSSVKGAIGAKSGALSPYRFISYVWNELVQAHPSLKIRTGTPVTAVSRSGTCSTSHPYEVTTADGRVCARHVLHATNPYISQLVPRLAGIIRPFRALMTAQEPPAGFPRLGGHCSWTQLYEDNYDYVTQLPDGPDGSPGLLMVGGAETRHEGGYDAQLDNIDDDVVDPLGLMHLRGVMPTLTEQAHGENGKLVSAWSGVYSVPRDYFPVVGPAPGTTPQGGLNGTGEWVATGYNGNGMVTAWPGGHAIGLMILGKENEDLPAIVGRSAGKVSDWWPLEEFSSLRFASESASPAQ